jgi:hypothetical protein
VSSSFTTGGANLDSTILVLLVVLLAAGALGLFFLMQKKRRGELQRKYGAEYEHTVKEVGDQRRAEKELESREKRVKSFKLHPLSSEQYRSFEERWRSVQALFVDEPSRAVQEADHLLKDAMNARGYPVGNFEQRAADLSVNHPRLVENYRFAKRIVESNSRGEATTEDLREVMLYYRDLFEDLLEDPGKKQDRKEYEEALR